MRRAVHGTEPQAREIAVLADPELVSALRLAGVARVRALRAEAQAREEVIETLQGWLAEEGMALVIVGAAHAELAREQLEAWRRQRRVLPVIVEVPSRDGPVETDAAHYYQQMGRDYLGLELRLEAEAGNGVADGTTDGATDSTTDSTTDSAVQDARKG